MAPSIRIAIIGLGQIGPRHAQSVLRCSETASLSCLVDPDPQAQHVADTLCIPLFASVGRMLESELVIDAAVVCTPNSTHASIGEELLEAGIHVLVEKPIAADPQSAQALLRCARRCDRHLLVGHHRRFNPYILASKRAITSGQIGTPIAVSGIWALHKPASYFRPPTDWHARSDQGGPVLINLVHEIDTLRYLFGGITRVHAERTMSQRGYDVEEGAAILLRFESGVVGSFLLSDATPSPHNFECGTGENPMIPKTGKDFYRIFGSAGTLSIGDMKLSRHGSSVEKDWTKDLEETSLQVGSEVPFDEQIKHFVQVINGVEQPRCSGQDGLQALLVCDLIKRLLINGEGVANVELAASC